MYPDIKTFKRRKLCKSLLIYGSYFNWACYFACIHRWHEIRSDVQPPERVEPLDIMATQLSESLKPLKHPDILVQIHSNEASIATALCRKPLALQKNSNLPCKHRYHVVANTSLRFLPFPIQSFDVNCFQFAAVVISNSKRNMLWICFFNYWLFRKSLGITYI